MRLIKAVSALAIASLWLAACGGSSEPTGINQGPPPPPPPNGVSVTNNAFTPAAMTVAVGKTVTWKWNSCSNDPYGGGQCVTHSVLFDDGEKSAQQSEGTYSRTFTEKGTYKYHCEIHGTAMSGTITVE